MIPRNRFIDAETSRYLGLDETLGELQPDSSAGRRALHRLEAYGPGDEGPLQAHMERLCEALALKRNQPGVFERLRHHLRDTPWLEDAWEDRWGQAELSLLTIFRHRHHKLHRELQASPFLSDWLKLVEPDQLGGKAWGSETPPSFYLTDDRSPDLAALRRDIRDLKQELDSHESERRARLAQRHGLPPAANHWVVDRLHDREHLDALMTDDELTIIGETVSTLRLAPALDAAHLKMAERLANRLQAERDCEMRLYGEMAALIRPQRDRWFAEADKLARLDLLLAQARLAEQWNANAADITSDREVPLVINRGRHLGIADSVTAAGGDYSPLSLEFDRPALVLSGTNMGGKTVVLQTVGWLQALVQFGFMVPVRNMRTHLMDGIVSVAASTEGIGGLSGFGREIDRLATFLPLREHPHLFLIDEPGRTTRVDEGRALARALAQIVTTSPSQLLMATHFDGITGDAIGQRRMAGLRRDRLKAWRAAARADRPPLHHLMDYRVTDTSDGASASDALDVAELLGLDTEIIAEARRLLSQDLLHPPDVHRSHS